MSDKIVRDELLRSHRYQTLASDTAKLLFLHLMLVSDHFSNAEANATAISIIMRREMSDEQCATLLTELHEKDLVRPYEHLGSRYVHIPRSRQRIRFKTAKHPRPPRHIEDSDIKELIEKVSRTSAEEKRSEVKKQDRSHAETPGKWWATTDTMKAKARALGLKDSPPGETRDAMYKRITAAMVANSLKAKEAKS